MGTGGTWGRAHAVFFVPIKSSAPPCDATLGAGDCARRSLARISTERAPPSAATPLIKPVRSRQMRHSGVFFGATKPAVKVPEVGTFGQVAAPFALDVFADFV